MENTIEKAKALGRDSIISEAKSIFKGKYPNLLISFSDFDITAWANNKEIIVRFNQRIKFVPINERIENPHYDFYIDIETKRVTPFDILGMSRFYLPNKEELEKIEFVRNAFNLPFPDFDNTIIETADTYEVMIENDHAFARYFLDKKTGEELTSLSIQGSYEAPPFIESDVSDPLIEIKD